MRQEGQQVYLVRLTGDYAGSKHQIGSDVVTIGRSSENHIIPQGESVPQVSARHVQIFRKHSAYWLRDLESTNGTFVNGKRIKEVELKSGVIIQLGTKGPEFQFLIGTDVSENLDKTLIIENPEVMEGSDRREKKKPASGKHETLLKEAVAKARSVRDDGRHGQTMIIMRELLTTAVVNSHKKHKLAIWVLVGLVVVLFSFSAWTSQRLKQQKARVDSQIDRIELELYQAEDPAQVEALIRQLKASQTKAQQIRRNLLYQLGAADEQEDFLRDAMSRIMADFGTSEYSIPPQFIERVRYYTERYSSVEQDVIERALITQRDALETMRTILGENHLPPDLAYMVVVETGFDFSKRSRSGAAGPWQLVAGTARAYGLRVDGEQDQRFDVEKSTRAAAKYIRRLLLDFGSGSSAMLALAAYNLGPTKVRRAIRNISDPIRQRDFWYLYRTGALPIETKEYIPKIIAAIVIGRHPERFGFQI